MRRKRNWFLVLAVALLGVAGLTVSAFSSAAATERTADPRTFQSQVAAARPGDTIRLLPGNYGAASIVGAKFTGTVAIDASQASFVSLVIRNSSGIAIAGATVGSYREQTFGVHVRDSRDIRVSRFKVSGAKVAIGVVGSQNVEVADNDFSGSRSDGVNVVQSRFVTVARNLCRDFHPIPGVYDAAGKLLKDGDHPDCVQGWSVAGTPPLSDITVVDNVAEGRMQGVFFAGQVGGFDRIVIKGNRLTLGVWNGIVLRGGRNSTVTGNTVRTVPDARDPNYPFHAVDARIRVDGEGNTVCGNSAEVARNSVGLQPC